MDLIGPIQCNTKVETIQTPLQNFTMVAFNVKLISIYCMDIDWIRIHNFHHLNAIGLHDEVHLPGE